MQENKSSVLIEIDLEEMAHISIALDRIVHLEKNGVEYSSFSKLQKKWDSLYKEIYSLRGLGVKNLNFGRRASV